MKNRPFFPGLLVILSVFLVTTGCETYPATSTQTVTFSNDGIFGEASLIPIKNFETRGLVFTQAELEKIEKPDRYGYTTEYTVKGDVFTYQELLKEAQKIGADAIINVTIDSVTRSDSGTIWYGSALAIKYTDILPPNTPVQPHSQQTINDVLKR